MERILSIVLCVIFSIPFCVAETICDTGYSVKNRWVIKASVSPYKHWESDYPGVHVGDYLETVHLPKTSFEVEGSYAVSRHFEIAVSFGFIDGTYIQPVDGMSGVHKQMIAPTLGCSLHFHLLPLFVKYSICRWDLYLLAKYNGCILPKTELNINSFSMEKYRNVYGIGVGISYFFKDIGGFFAEFTVGQFSYFPTFVNSNVNYRVGVAFKINRKHI